MMKTINPMARVNIPIVPKKRTSETVVGCASSNEKNIFFPGLGVDWTLTYFKNFSIWFLHFFIGIRRF
jgi:hypothetical protein